jgi:hypothetical protein
MQVIFECRFLGCYKPTPLKRNLVLEIRLVSKEMGKLLPKGIFSFPCCFCFSVPTPLNMTNSDGCHFCLNGDCV